MIDASIAKLPARTKRFAFCIESAESNHSVSERDAACQLVIDASNAKLNMICAE